MMLATIFSIVLISASTMDFEVLVGTICTTFNRNLEYSLYFSQGASISLSSLFSQLYTGSSFQPSSTLRPTVFMDAPCFIFTPSFSVICSIILTLLLSLNVCHFTRIVINCNCWVVFIFIAPWKVVLTNNHFRPHIHWIADPSAFS
ncbi:Aquaporin AQPcic, partial [Bienertia sinuspersici]